MPFMRERLRQRRIDMGLTLREVADLVEVKKPTIQRYESGKIHKIDTLRVEKLAFAIKCNPSFLMGWVNDPQIDQNTTLHLTAAETNLVIRYRLMNREGQEKVSEYIDDLNKTDKYKKDSQNGVVAEKKI